MTNKKTWMYLAGCLLMASWLCMAQILGSRPLLLACLLGFLLLVAVSGIRKISLPVLMFFLPWSTLLKAGYGGLSFYTFALIVSCIIVTIKQKFVFQRYQIVLTLLILVLTLVSKVVDGETISFSYLMFIFMLFLFPGMAMESDGKYSFFELVVFFSIGIISAALTAQKFVGYPNIARYIDVYTYKDLTRLSGYYGDANFYSAHITAALSGTLLLLLQVKNSGKKIMLSTIAIFLFYCGLLSASKSFFLVSMCIFTLWIVCFMRLKIAFWIKLLALGGIVGGLTLVLTSDLFSRLIEMVLFRFSQANNISGFTTGRSDTWAKYLAEMGMDWKTLFIGRGYSRIVLFDHATHNTILQIVFQLGLAGASLIFIWIICFMKQTIRCIQEIRIPIIFCVILAMGTFLPWMAIDLLFFDEFFLMQLFVYIGVCNFSEVRF